MGGEGGGKGIAVKKLPLDPSLVPPFCRDKYERDPFGSISGRKGPAVDDLDRTEDWEKEFEVPFQRNLDSAIGTLLFFNLLFLLVTLGVEVHEVYVCLWRRRVEQQLRQAQEGRRLWVGHSEHHLLLDTIVSTFSY